MPDYTVTLTDVEVKAFEYVANSIQDWIDNSAHNRARQARDQIYDEEVARMTDDPDISTIPANKDQVVLDADIETAKERADRFEAEQEADK